MINPGRAIKDSVGCALRPFYLRDPTRAEAEARETDEGTVNSSHALPARALA